MRTLATFRAVPDPQSDYWVLGLEAPFTRNEMCIEGGAGYHAAPLPVQAKEVFDGDLYNRPIFRRQPQQQVSRLPTLSNQLLTVTVFRKRHVLLSSVSC